MVWQAHHNSGNVERADVGDGFASELVAQAIGEDFCGGRGGALQFAVGVQRGELCAQREGGVGAHSRLHRGINHAGGEAGDAHPFGGGIRGVAVQCSLARAVDAPAGVGFARRAAADVNDAHAVVVARVGEDGVGEQQRRGDVEAHCVNDDVIGLCAERGGGGDGASVVDEPEGFRCLAGVAEGVAAAVIQHGLRVGEVYCGFL